MAGEEEEPNWMTPKKNFLIRGVLPPNENEAWCLKMKGPLLRHPWWWTIQKRVDNILAQMLEQPIGRLCHERTSWRDLWPSQRGMLPCNQTGVCQLLLADTQGRCPRLHKEVQTMPSATYGTKSWYSSKLGNRRRGGCCSRNNTMKKTCSSK